MIVRNPNRSVRYWSTNERRFIDEFNVFQHLVPRVSLDAHLCNANLGRYDLQRYRPVLPGIYPVPPRTAWQITEGQIRQINPQNICPARDSIKKANIEKFDIISKNFFRKFGSSSIAVELSGGLDSTLVLVALAEAGFCPILIGARWSNYETRTERVIQDILMSKFNFSAYIFEDSIYPFGDMLNVPRHFLPSPACFYWTMHNKNITICSQLGIRAILSGDGGDALLSDPLEPSGNCFIHAPWAWGLDWAQDVIYSSCGVRYISAFSFRSVAQGVVDLRRNAGSTLNADTKKALFRDLYSERIPPELSRYYYKASGTALHLDGLMRAENHLSQIFRAAYEIYRDQRLDRNILHKGLKNYSFMSSKEIKEFESIISFACWIWSNMKD